MKKISRTVFIASSLVVFGGLIAGFSTAASVPGHMGSGHHGHHGKINALKLDADKDGALSQEELLSHNTKRFARLDSNEDGSISRDEFNARLIVMFEKMDSNGDGILKGVEMPKGR